jgi:hypothetical protein
MILCLVLLAAACTNEGESTTSTSTTAAEPSTTTTIEIDPIQIVIDELAAITEDIRGLDFLTSPTVVFVSDDELADRVRETIDEELDPDETVRDELLLKALGLLSPGVDLESLYTDLYAEQVAGFYDGEVQELVVPIGDGELSELQRLTLVHELTHALTDQYFEFADRMVELDDAQQFEQVAALSALVEGDASLTETLYLQSQSREHQLAVLEASMEIDTTVFDQTPRFLQELLLFPYTAGYDFVTAVWESGGFTAVDQLYSSTPTTTEQIYYPADFLAGELPVIVADQELIADGYEVAETSVWGQAAFRAMFGQALDDQVATAAAVGWGGDSYRLLWDGGSEIVFDLGFVADSTIDADEMLQTLAAFVAAQIDAELELTEDDYLEFVGEDFAAVYRDGEVIRFVVATDPAVGELFVEGLER